ncbi:hypothetical protein R1sor_016684 [Riccia sorocarpa]|uniref:Uncharacterized protein n=1 Tax=Riccia sorocarpa TaxID=122646 RepID=A0ABD3HFN6_9MARC
MIYWPRGQEMKRVTARFFRRLASLNRNVTDNDMRPRPRGGGGVTQAESRHNGHAVRDQLAEYLFSTA